MKKIFKIASYDFRRLMFNPISLIVLIVALIGILIFGATYKIPTAPDLTANTSGQTTHAIYNNFNSNSIEIDTKSSLQSLLNLAKTYIQTQKSCADYTQFAEINTDFQNFLPEVIKFQRYKNPDNISNDAIKQFKQSAQNLKTFVQNYAEKQAFESNMLMSKASFQTLQQLSVFFDETVNGEKDKAEMLSALDQNISKFSGLNSVYASTRTWSVGSSAEISAFENSYISVAEKKLEGIESKMSTLRLPASTQNAGKMISLITTYKLTCWSAKIGLEQEFLLHLDNAVRNDGNLKNLSNLHKFQAINREETKITLVQINQFLKDENPYYTPSQTPLNFNTASSTVTAYDNTFTMISIIGFFTILFGIYASFRLFGQDRKNGKMDMVLSQDVTFGQVFVAKFLAIVFCTSFVLATFLLFSLVWSLLFFPTLAGQIFAVFGTSTAYSIHPLLFLLIKVLLIQLQVIFWSVGTIFMMNLSRRFEIMFAITLLIFAIATICNIFCNGAIAYCLFPFIHADLSCMLGGGKANPGFLQTPIYAYGSFFISLAYYSVVVVLLFSFTKQLFKKN